MIITLMLFINNHCIAMNWSEIFDVHATNLPNKSKLHEQYKAYASSHAPTIADQRIKEIPINENNEELVDLRSFHHERIQMLPDPSMPFEGADFNSGLLNASKMRVSIFNKLQMMIFALDDLSSRFGYEPGQINIKVFEGLRDINTQKMLFEKKLEEILASNPELTLEMAELEAAKWISPYKNNVPVHSTGAAVDIRLWDNKAQKVLDMGIFGVIWSKNDGAPTFSEDLSVVQKKNRLFCLIAAEYAGLTNYVYEYWHYSSGDRYDAYWKNEKKALYGSIDN